MSGTFEKLMKNRDYWRDEAKAKRASETIRNLFPMR